MFEYFSKEHLNGDEEQLKYIVYNYGPTVVVIYASEDFTQYSTGVFSELDCPNSPNRYAGVPLTLQNS